MKWYHYLAIALCVAAILVLLLSPDALAWGGCRWKLWYWYITHHGYYDKGICVYGCFDGYGRVYDTTIRYGTIWRRWGWDVVICPRNP